MKKPTRENLLNTFCNLKDFFPTTALNSFIKDLENYLKDNDDAEIISVLLVVKTFQYNLKTNNLQESYNAVAPVFEYYKCKTNWSFTDLIILTSTITFTATYEQAKNLAQEILDVLDDYEHEKAYGNVMYAVRFNLTPRLLWARYVDINDPAQNVDIKELEELFMHHYTRAVKVCELANRPVQKTVLQIRKNTLFGNCEAIDAGFKWLYKNKAHNWYNATQHEIADFFCEMGANLTKWQLDVIIGSRIRKRREELGLSLPDVADHLGITETAFASAERGMKGLMNIKLFRLAAHLGVDVGYFYPTVEDKVAATIDSDPYLRQVNSLFQNELKDSKGQAIKVLKALLP